MHRGWIVVILALTHVFFGFLAYGFRKGVDRNRYAFFGMAGYSIEDERQCWLWASSGLLAYLMIIYYSAFGDTRLRGGGGLCWCLKMPDHLREKGDFPNPERMRQALLSRMAELRHYLLTGEPSENLPREIHYQTAYWTPSLIVWTIEAIEREFPDQPAMGLYRSAAVNFAREIEASKRKRISQDKRSELAATAEWLSQFIEPLFAKISNPDQATPA